MTRVKLDEVVAITSIVVALGTIIALLWRMFRRWGRVVDAILGVPKSQGIDERPGIIQKVDMLRATVDTVSDKLDDHISWHTTSAHTPNLNGVAHQRPDGRDEARSTTSTT